jgi:hypothetical protein
MVFAASILISWAAVPVRAQSGSPSTPENLHRTDRRGATPPADESFFDEDWENFQGGTFNSDYYGNFAPSSQLRVQNEVVAGGTYAAEHLFPEGSGPEYATQHFGDSLAGPVWSTGAGERYDDLYIQYKIRYSPGFDFARGIKQLIIGTQDSRRHDNTCCNPWVSHYFFTIVTSEGVLGAERNHKYPPAGQWLGLYPNANGYGPSNLFYMQPGRWYTIEVRRRLNDAGVNNGIFEMWVDGELISDYPNVTWRVPWDGTYGDDFARGTNFVMISNHISDPSPREQSVYYDDFKISTSFIPFD